MPVDHLVPVGINVKGALQDVVVTVSVKGAMDLIANVKVTTACVTRHVVQSPVAMVSQFCNVWYINHYTSLTFTVADCACGPSCTCGDKCKGSAAGCCCRCVCKMCDGSDCKCESDNCLCDKACCAKSSCTGESILLCVI